MSPQAVAQQILAFHAAIIDNCDRAARPDRSDTLALRLRENAAILAKLQLAMLTLTQTEPAREPVIAAHNLDLDFPEPPDPEPQLSPAPDRMLSGDALSRFVSRRLEPGESPHDVWQALNDSEPPAKRRRNPALPRPASPGKGFRSRAS